MAAATQKKSTNSAKKRSSQSGGTRAKKPAAPPKQPIRREVWGIVLLVLALCTGVSYFRIPAIFIDWFALLLKGLFGYGYWLAAPAFLLAGLILLFHRGRPVQLRVFCTLLVPVVLGAVEFPTSAGALKQFWVTGTSMTSGGAVSGALAEGAVKVFSKVASIIVFTALLVVLVMVSLRPTVGAIVEKHRSRPLYEPQPEPEQPRVRVVPLEPARRSTAERARPVIDIPLDDPTLPAVREKEPGR